MSDDRKKSKKKPGTKRAKKSDEVDAAQEAEEIEPKPNPESVLERRSTRALILCALATVAFVALDLWTKDLAVDNLSRDRIGAAPEVCADGGMRGMQRFPGEAHVVVEDYLEFRYAENCGAAFGLLDDAPTLVRQIVFGSAGVIATVVLFMLFFRGSGGVLFAWSVPLIVSGAVGNLVDRARLGYVVDFIRFHLADSWEYPTFNVADITITIGVVLLVIDSILEERRKGASDPKASTAAAE